MTLRPVFLIVGFDTDDSINKTLLNFKMKLLYRIGLSLITLVLLAACKQEAEFSNNEEALFGEYEVIIAASQVENQTDPETRTEVEDWSKVFWLPADKISVFSAGQMGEFTSQNTTRAASAFFKGRLFVDTDDLYNGGWITALYPFDANATIDGTVITTTLPTVQQAVAGGVADDLLATAARSRDPFVLNGDIKFSIESTGMETSVLSIDEDGLLTAEGLTSLPVQSDRTGPVPEVAIKMRFDHICSGLRFCLTQEGIETVTLSSIGGEPLAGTFSFTWVNNVPTVQSVSAPSSSITLIAPDGGTFEPGVWYVFITLPVVMNSGLSFTLTSGTKTGQRIISSSVNLKRAAFSRCTNMDKNVELVDDTDVEVQVADPTTWTAIDELGRSVLSNENPAAKDNRDVLMFYWTWHESRQVAIYDANGNQIGGTFNGSGVPDITDNTVVLVQSNGAAADNFFHPYWASSQVCFWGRPLFDYYRTTDTWVLRKHAEMLADAGVDAVVFDCSNGDYLWWDSTMALLQTWNQARIDGVKVPRIVFLLNFIVCEETRTDLRFLYNNLYKNGLYEDLWYKVDGHPLIIGFPESLDLEGSTGLDNTIKSFFTFRRPQADYINGDIGTSDKPYWGWLETHEQHLFNGEEMTVGVSQNATKSVRGHCYAFNAPGSYGRSYTRAHENGLLSGSLSNISTASFIQGYNFQEQWDTAIQADPRYVFVTGWNEWIAGKGAAFPVNIDGTAPSYYDAPTGKTYQYTPYGTWNGVLGPPAFADQYDSERSRDIEPTHFWGDYGDVYYYQLAKNIRQYKGVAAYPNVSRKVTMEIDGDFSGWEKVSPDFKHYRGNTFNRNHYNHTSNGTRYTDYTGRNDFVDARVTRDNQYIYFYVETDQAITSRNDPAWMRLFINIDHDASTGWKGYDFCLNYRNPASANTGYVSSCSNNAWSWTDAGTFDYAISGNKMEIRVARSVLGIAASAPLDFDFKWSDNMQLYNANYDVDNANGTAWILDFLVSGDCAPGGRFNFHYKDY